MGKKITEIVLTDFRGYKGQHNIKIGDADLVVLLGLNGFGKSTIFDAVEWCFTGKIGRFEKFNDVGRKLDFGKEKELLRNKYVLNPNTSIKVHLTGDMVFGRKVLAGPNENDYGPGVPIPGTSFGIDNLLKEKLSTDEINSYFTATHVLSQETINHFVTSKKPDERYNALSVNFGTSQYLPFEANCSTLLKKIKERIKLNLKDVQDLDKMIGEMNKNLENKKFNIDQDIIQFNRLIILIPIKEQYKNIDSNFLKIKENITGLQQSLIEYKTTLDNDLIKYNRQLEVSEFLLNGFDNFKDIDSKLESDEKALTSLKFKREEYLKTKNKNKNLEIEIERQKSILKIKKSSMERIEKILNNPDQISKSIEYLRELKVKLGEVELEVSKLKQSIHKLQTERNNLLDLNKIELMKINLLKSTLEIMKEQKWLSNSALEHQQHISQKLAEIEALQVKNEDEKKTLSVYIDRSKQGFEHFLSFFEDFDEKDHQYFPVVLENDFVSKVRRLKFLRSQLQILDSDYKGVVTQLASENDYQSKLIQALNVSLEEINHSENHDQCPVCDSKFTGDELKKKLERKISNFSSSKVNLLESKRELISRNLLQTNSEITITELELRQDYESLVQKLYLKFSDLDKKALKLDSSLSETRVELERVSDLKNKLANDLTSIGIPFDDKNLHDVIASNLDKNQKTHSENLQAIDQITKRIELESKSLDETEKNYLGIKYKIRETLDSSNYIEIKVLFKELFDREIDGITGVSLLSDFAKHKDNTTLEINILESKIDELTKDQLEARDSLDIFLKENDESDVDFKIGSLVSSVDSLRSNFILIQERLSILGIDYAKFKKDILENKLGEIIKHLSEFRVLLENTVSAQQLVRGFQDFNKNHSVIDRLAIFENDRLGLLKTGEKLNQLKDKVESTRKAIPEILESHIKKNLDVSLFNSIYSSLNPHRRFKSIDFDVRTSHGKVGINFKATHGKISGSPEYLFSSAQLNTFGVSMFLSMALRQNWLDLDTVLLDDPIQNLDDINVLSFIDLMRSLLDRPDKKQVVISTHDERFFNLLLKKFSSYRLKAFKFNTYGELDICQTSEPVKNGIQK